MFHAPICSGESLGGASSDRITIANWRRGCSISRLWASRNPVYLCMNFETLVGPLVVDGDKRGPTAVHVPTLLSLPSLPFVIPNLLYGA